MGLLQSDLFYFWYLKCIFIIFTLMQDADNPLHLFRSNSVNAQSIYFQFSNTGLHVYRERKYTYEF